MSIAVLVLAVAVCAGYLLWEAWTGRMAGDLQRLEEKKRWSATGRTWTRWCGPLPRAMPLIVSQAPQPGITGVVPGIEPGPQNELGPNGDAIWRPSAPAGRVGHS